VNDVTLYQYAVTRHARSRRAFPADATKRLYCTLRSDNINAPAAAAAAADDAAAAVYWRAMTSRVGCTVSARFVP